MKIMSNYTALLSPLNIRGHHYKNRIISAPTLFAHSVFIPEIRENVFRMVEKRAKGGCAEVPTGEICFNFEEGICAFVEPFDYNDTESYEFKSFQEYARRIKENGAVAMIEFCHEAGRAETKPPYVPYGPSAFLREDGVQVHEMTEEIMDKICKDLRTAIRFMKKAGFDGVLFHGGHGFIFQQFISPWTNHRTDEYGGSMENRARFPMRMLREMREEMGEDMVLELRISAQDGVEGGMTIDDLVEFCKIIDGMADIIQISNGLKWAGNRTYTFTDMYDAHGHNVQYAAKVKAAVTKSKVAVIGGINSPEFANQVIAEGKTDFVVMGRQMYADPEFANKVAAGKPETIRRCVRCFQCYPGTKEHETDLPFEVRFTEEEKLRIFNPASMGRCAINPHSNFRLYEEQYPLPESPKKVLVVGGGVAGLQAALSAAERGNQVILAEATDELGGVLNFTEKDPDKVDLCNAKNVIINDVENSSVEIRMNTTVTEAMMAEIKPDVLILAVGADPIKPKIPGIEHAISAVEMYQDLSKVGDKVALIGGGLVGCEVGLMLREMEKDVTVIEMQDILAREAWCMYRTALIDEVYKRDMRFMLSTSCKEILPDGVVVSKDGEEQVIPADTIIYSVGMRSRTEVVETLKNAAENMGIEKIFVIGDAKKAGKVGDATFDGHFAALNI